MGGSRFPFLRCIPVFYQVFVIAIPMVLNNLWFAKGVDLGVLMMFSSILILFIYASIVFATEREVLTQLRWMDCLFAVLCGVVGASQKILSVINYGLVSSSISSTVAMVIPITIVFLDTLSSVLSKNKEKKKISVMSRSIVSKGLAVLIWVFAAIVSHPKIFQGPVIIPFNRHNESVIAPAPDSTTPIQDPSWAATIGAIALSLAGSAPIATWCTNSLKENKINPELSCSFLVSTMNYFIQLILLAMYAIYCDWKNNSYELVSFNTYKTVDWIIVVVSTGLTVLLTLVTQKKGGSYAAPFAYIYLVIEVIAIPLALDKELHLRSIVGAFLLICGIYVYNHWDSDDEKEESTSMTSNVDQEIVSGGQARDVTIVLEK